MSKPLHTAQRGDAEVLRAHLADTIGAEVEAAMDGVGWDHTMQAPSVNPNAVQSTPPPEGVVDNPQAQVNPNAPEPSATTVDWEQFRDNNGLILGKYKDAASAARGMHSLLHMTKNTLSELDTIKAERDAIAKERDQLRYRPSQPEAEAVQTKPLSNSKIQTLLDKIRQGEGLDAEDIPLLIEGTAEQAEAIATRKIEDYNKQVSGVQKEWQEVDSYMTQNHPDSMNFVDEMMLFVKTNPEVGRIYNRLLSDPDGKLDATIYAWEKFSNSSNAPIDPAKAALEQKLQVQKQVRQEEVDKERRHAGLLGSSPSGVHETVQAAGPTQEEIQAAIARKGMDNGASWRQLTIVPSLNHPIFDNP